ncbi:MAG: glycine cleavage system aminomethyltransferase GcvT [Bacteroidia bacterium]|nr:glycine cleavage system aminomethyltransferase GcvT [Bacteroidia bacterium]MDW8348165.1 glycine cleavage system aminomethyltransferase GcvT [Bacteroidia bacterium]
MATQRTALYDVHVASGAKMVVFAGFDMPVRYTGDLDEHFAVRNSVGIFDVSHMGEFIIRGKDALPFLQYVTSNDVSKLTVNKAQYSCIPNDRGGIVDDIIVYRVAEDQYMMVVNAANIQKDWIWLNQHKEGYEVELVDISEKTSLFAVQGKNALPTLQKLTSANLKEVAYYTFVRTQFNGVDNVIIAATGYTGEPGFEVFFDAQHSVSMWNAILDAGREFNLKPIGLGARDTLRLEMGYCLYGNDIDDDTSPLEAGLGWITKFQKGRFVGSEVLLAQKEQGIKRYLTGFVMQQDKAIPRAGYSITDASGAVIGKVTSGTQSPILKQGIGLGYVPCSYKEGDTVYIQIRDKISPAVLKKPPFVRIEK